MFIYRARYSILYKAITSLLVCLFLVNNVAWADTSSTSTLAAESRLKPFLEKHGLDFQNAATVMLAAGQLRDMIATGEARQGNIMRLNKLFIGGDIEIGKDIKQDNLKCSGRTYEYAVFHFKKANKAIGAIFVNDNDELTDDELKELGVNTDKDREPSDSSAIPAMRGVWFVSPATGRGPALPLKPPPNTREARKNSSPEYSVMLDAMKGLIRDKKDSPGYNNAYSYIRAVAENKLKKFDANSADEAMLEIKKWLVESTFAPGEQEAVRQLMLNQAKEYFDLVNGFGAIAYNANTDSMDDLTPREEMHEDIFSASLQAVDTLQMMGDVSSLPYMLALARKGLEAHKTHIDLDLMQKRVDNARKQLNKEDERRYNIVLSCHFEAVRRWMSTESWLIKCISNQGLRAGSGSAEYAQTNAFLNEVMLNHEATGEAYYWIRQQAAYRLRDYPTEETIRSLTLTTDGSRPEGQSPHPATVFIAMNLEAANPKALTISLAAGQSLLHIQRQKAEKEIIADPENFDFEQKKFRFVRLIGALDAIRREDAGNDIRIRILRRIAGMHSDEAAFASNFLLDAMEEMVKGQRNIYARIFKSEKVSEELKDPRIRKAALEVIARIGKSILPRLRSDNPALSTELSQDIDYLLTTAQDLSGFDQERFRKIGRKLHVTLGNLHRLRELESFAQGEEYLDFNRKVVIGSGGGASVSMSGVIDRITTDPALAIIGATDNGGATLLVRAFESVRNGIFVGGFGDHIRFMYEAAVLEGARGP